MKMHNTQYISEAFLNGMYVSSFSLKVQVSVSYPMLDTARHWNPIGTLFNVKIINYFKNYNYLNSYRLKEQLTNCNIVMLYMNKISTIFGIDEIDSHATISGPSALWYPKQPSHIIPFLHSSSSTSKTRCLVSTAHTQDFHKLSLLKFAIFFYVLA